MSSLEFASVLSELEKSSELDPVAVEHGFEALFAGLWAPTQIAGFLLTLRAKGETHRAIAAAARAMRRVMLPVEHGLDVVIDTCGTGGDGSSSLNISTGAAILVAAAGVHVAKHGNRAASSRSGSADVLEALGVALNVAPEKQSDILKQHKIAFLFAQAHHPAMRNVNSVRKELGVRTLMNYLGPLANPARATHQLLGAANERIRPTLAAALLELGSQRAWVVHSHDGLDELSPFSATRVTEVRNGQLAEFEVAPEDFGLTRSPAGAIAGGDAKQNAEVLRGVLAAAHHPSRDAFVLNAAAALVVARDMSPQAAKDQVLELIMTGQAAATLEDWRASTVRLTSQAVS